MEYNPANAKLQIGDIAPYFSLPATNEKIYSISDFADAKALAIIFTSNHCPYAQAYEIRLCELVEEFSTQEVAIIAICSNDGELFPEDSFEQMIEKSKKYNFSYLYLQDSNQKIAKAYSAAVTPECFLFNQERQLCYHGSFDDDYAHPESVKKRYLAEAIQAVLQDKEPEVSISEIRGCTIKFRS